MKRRMAFSVAKAILMTAFLAGLAGNAAAQAAPADKSAGGYKIAVVDRKAVFDEYQKKISEWTALETKKKGIEDELNKEFEQLRTDRDAYDKGRDGMPEDQRQKKEAELNKRLLDLQSKARLKQDEVTKDGERIIKTVTGEINQAIQKIGQDGGYHLILEADTAISSVVYFAQALDITPQVKEYMKANGGAAATTKVSSDTDKAVDKTAKKEDKKR